jgi:hypothetical protein
VTDHVQVWHSLLTHIGEHSFSAVSNGFGQGGLHATHMLTSLDVVWGPPAILQIEAVIVLVLLILVLVLVL